MNKLGLAVLLAVGALFLWWQAPRMPYLSNDAYQYIDAAAEVSAGKCLCTRVAHFDEQLQLGHFPVPFTHFAPGYPLLVAGVSRLGMSLETAAYAVSIVSFLVTLWMFWIIAESLGALWWIALAFGLLWATHATALNMATRVATEEPFTAVLLILVALMLRQKSHPRTLVAVAFFAGAAYWLRYAGLFLIPIAGLYIIWKGWRTRKFAWAGSALTLLAALMLTVQIRNVHYTGSWRGGFSAGQSHRLTWVVVETLKAFYHVAFGDRAVARADPWSVLFLVSIAILVWLSYKYWQGRSFTSTAWEQWFWLAAVCGLYVAGIMAVALNSIAADFTRYYLPLYPLALAAVSAAISKFPATVWRTAAVAAAVLSVLAVQGRSLAIESQPSPHDRIVRALNEPLQSGGTSREWLMSHTQLDDVIVAVDGQPLHYLLQRPVISVLGPEYSDHPQDEPVLHGLMKRFRARYLIVFPGMIEAQEQIDNPFLTGLANGIAPPAWLQNAARSKAVAILECRECAQ